MQLMRLRVHAAVILAVVLLSYGPDVGRGFVKEDAAWVMRSRIEAPRDALRPFTETGGFYRPLVALSFSLNHRLFGSNPLGYGWTNLVLALCAAAAVWRLGLALGLPAAAALLAAGLWILNFHGINMAVLWLSGRTALLLVIFAVLAAIAAARDRLGATCLFGLLAALSKEEAVLLPVMLLGIVGLRPGGATPGRLMAFAASLAVTFAIYGGLRMLSDAATPATVPPFYRFTFDSNVLVTNAREYADRTLTLSMAVVVLTLAICRQGPRMTPRESKIIAAGGLWLIGGFGLTFFLPVRSALYVLLPSVGAAIGAAVMVSAAWTRARPTRQRAAAALALCLPVLLIPVYWQRNARWTELAAISRQVLSAFADLSHTAPERWEVILVDDPTTRASVTSALGFGIVDAVELVTGRKARVFIVPPPPEFSPDEWVVPPRSAHAILALRDGSVVRLSPEEWDPVPAGAFY